MFLSKILRAADHPYLTGHGGRKVRFKIYFENNILWFINIFLFTGQQRYPHGDAGNDHEVHQAPRGPAAPVRDHGRGHRLRVSLRREVRQRRTFIN